MNKVIVSGRICQDLELRAVSTGSRILNFILAIPRDKEHTDFIKIVAFGKTAETLNSYCKKGDKILVEGSINTSQYEKDGKKINDYNIMANRVEFLEMRKEETKEIKTFKTDPYKEMGKIVGPEEIEITDEDLPF